MQSVVLHAGPAVQLADMCGPTMRLGSLGPAFSADRFAAAMAQEALCAPQLERDELGEWAARAHVLLLVTQTSNHPGLLRAEIAAALASQAALHAPRLRVNGLYSPEGDIAGLKAGLTFYLRSSAITAQLLVFGPLRAT